MASPSFPLTGAQKNAFHAAVEQPPVVPDFARTGEANPNLRVFVVNFDGTQNDRTCIPDGERATLVAACDERLQPHEGPVLQSRYYKGVGTGGSRVRRLVESAFGEGCIRNAEAAYNDLARQVSQWRQVEPESQVHVHVVGFSRGAATALDFLNLVHERGALSDLYAIEGDPDDLGPGKVYTSAVLYDTVSTGQGGTLKLTVPRTCVAALHLVAGGEERTLFPLREISEAADCELSIGKNVRLPGAPEIARSLHYRRLHEITLPGARHSDVGGSYGDGGIREVSQYLAESFQASLGLPIVPKKPSFRNIQECHFHDSRFIQLYNDPAARQNALRETEAVQHTTWDGAYIACTRIEGVGDAPAESVSKGKLALKGQVHPFQQQIGRRVQAQIVCAGAAASDELSFGSLALRTRSPEVFSEKDGKLMVHGAPLKGLTSLADLHERLQRNSQGMEAAQEGQEVQEGQGDPSVRVSFEVWRQGSECDAKQRPGHAPLPRSEQSPDPWPKALRDAIQRTNSGKPIDRHEATELMANAVDAVMRELDIPSAAPKFKKIRIEQHTFTIKRKDSLQHINRHHLSCEDGTVTLNSRVKIKVPKIYEAHMGRMRELGEGLDALAVALRIEGWRAPKGASWSYFPHLEKSVVQRVPMVEVAEEPTIEPMRVSSLLVNSMTQFLMKPLAENASPSRLAKPR